MADWREQLLKFQEQPEQEVTPGDDASAIVARVLGIDVEALKTKQHALSLSELGATSLDLIELAVRLEMALPEFRSEDLPAEAKEWSLDDLHEFLASKRDN